MTKGSYPQVDEEGENLRRMECYGACVESIVGVQYYKGMVSKKEQVREQSVERALFFTSTNPQPENASRDCNRYAWCVSPGTRTTGTPYGSTTSVTSR